ncbi:MULTISPECIES: biliverdin-producing heme oxygenase [Crossiella]|uniref:Heme oxygenase n=1 Tax=Crossiella cryophila TaxID=43355 RepID=A0A7W7CGX4_9PSEU|nr:biliverdin-producing heme oxygenase [Crossiella cryophila]MBB4680996.1 heme oxygenase [Crossiella cryophila]
MSENSETVAPQRFSTELRARTRGDHAQAQQLPYVDAMLAGKLSRAGYAEMVAQQYFAYSVLEQAAQVMRTDPIGRRFVLPELDRAPALAEDLAYLLGLDWQDRITPSPATLRYLDRMRAVCFDWPGGFIAHHYTRYLGDLSGGQIIQRCVIRAYDLPGDRGASAYTFPLIKNVKRFKDGYREMLDLLPFDPAQQRRVIEEAIVAYRHNIEVFDDLGRDLPAYLVA